MDSATAVTLPTPLRLSDRMEENFSDLPNAGNPQQGSSPSAAGGVDHSLMTDGMERVMADETADAFSKGTVSPKSGGNRQRTKSDTKKKMSYAMAETMRQKGEKAKVVAAERGKTYIHPKNKTKIRWDMYCGILIVYSVCLIPWRIGFEVEATGAILYFDYCVDICFAFDMILCFFTAYYEEEMLIVNLPQIRSTYLKTWFVPDLLSTVPIDKVAELILGTGENTEVVTQEVNCSIAFEVGGGGGGGTGNELAGFRLIRILRLARLLKLMRLLKLSKKGSNVDMNELINPAIRKLLNVLGKIIFIAHLLSCVWFGVNDCEPLAKIEASKSDPCIEFEPEEHWLMCGKDNLLSQYIASIYWTIATMMAVGYGDVSPGTTGERCFGIMTQVVGAMSFGLIIATVGIIVDTINPEATLRKRRMDTLTAFMEERGITKSLRRQVKDHFEYFYTYKTIFNESMIFHDIPPMLKAQLVFELKKSDLKLIKFFHDLDLVFVTELVVKLKPMCLNYMQTLGCTGSFNAEAYFITKGKVQGLVPVGTKDMTICGLFKEGDDFEMDTMLTDMIMRCSYRSIAVTDLLWMECEDFNELSEEYPACGENVRVHALQHKQMIEEAIDSETKEIEGIGMAQAKVVFESQLCNFEDVLASFEMETNLSVSKIRTYRNVMVGDSAANFSTDDLKKMAKQQNANKLPIGGKVKSTFFGTPGSKIIPKGDSNDDPSIGSPNIEQGKHIQKKPLRNRAATTGSFQTELKPGASSSEGSGLKAKDSPKGSPKSSPKGSGATSTTTPSSPSQRPSQRNTIQIIRRKDSSASHGQMVKLDTPLQVAGLFKHGTFMKSKQIIKVEVEETTAELAARYIINPKDGRKISWDLFIGGLIVWSVIIVPFRLGFNQEPEKGSTQDIIDVTQDILFFVDIILCFRVAFLDEQLVYVTEPRMIAEHYFKTWFIIDFLSTIPVDRFIGAPEPDFLLDSTNSTNGTDIGGEEVGGGQAARSLKMIKVLRLIRLSKLARLFKLKNLIKGMDEILALSAVAMKALQLVTILIFIGHLFGCFWNYTSANLTDMITDDPNRWWQSPILKDVDGENEEEVSDLYVASLYWAFTTMTTVGYGDILPTNDVERVYATIIMVLGATIFGYIVGSVGALAVNVNGAPARRHAKVSMAMNYLSEHQLPKYHSVNVKKQILFYLECKSPFNEDGSLLSILPREMRREVILQSHKNIIPHIPLFKRQSRDFISFLLTKMRPQMVVLGQTILDSNMGSDGIYFLIHGTARMVIMDKKKQEEVTSIFIEEGRFFGHEIYIEDELTNDASLYRLYKSVKDCELFVLLDIDISHLLDSWPCLAKQLKLALHQMIRSQPPLKFNTMRARKPRKSMKNFNFGTKTSKTNDEVPSDDFSTDKQALKNILAKLHESGSVRLTHVVHQDSRDGVKVKRKNKFEDTFKRVAKGGDEKGEKKKRRSVSFKVTDKEKD